MDGGMVAGILGAAVAFIGMVVGIVKWFISGSEARVEKRLDEHNDKFKEHNSQIRDNEKAINDTRDELHRDYVHQDHLDKFTSEMRDGMAALFKKMDAMARDLNRLIGGQSQRGNHDDT